MSSIFRKIPASTRGKGRLARLVLGETLDQYDFPVTDRWGSLFIVPYLREIQSFHLLIDGVYEPPTIQLLFQNLRRGSIFVDVGGNIGTFTIPIARHVGTHGIVLSIEASPFIVHYLKKNIVLNGLSNVRLKNCAAYDQNMDSLPFYEAPLDRFGMGSCAPQFHNNPLSVQARTLDFLLETESIPRVDVIKVDVEGYEAFVFRGAKQLLTTTSPLIVFEFADWAEARVPGSRCGESQKLLREYGYKIWTIRHFLDGKKPLQKIIDHGFEVLVASKNHQNGG